MYCNKFTFTNHISHLPSYYRTTKHLKNSFQHRCFNDFMKCLIIYLYLQSHFHILQQFGTFLIFSYHFYFSLSSAPKRIECSIITPSSYAYDSSTHFYLNLRFTLTSRVYFGTPHTFHFIGSAQIAKKIIFKNVYQTKIMFTLQREIQQLRSDLEKN